MNEIKSTFYHFQPLHLETNLFIQLFFTNFKKDNLKTLSTKIYPKWIESYMKVNMGLYNTKINLNLNIDNSHFIELKKFFNKNKFNNIDLSNYCDEENFSIYLLYDFNLKYFILGYEISFKYPKEITNIIFNPSNDFYNYIRNITVEDGTNNKISSWFILLKKSIYKTISNMCKDVIGFNENSVIIEPNTCNITHVISDIEKKDCKLLMKNLKTINENAERLEFEKENYLKVNNGDLYLFKSRFHTIFINNEKNLYRYIPIQFYMQYMWFYSISLNKLIKELENYGNIKNLSKEQSNSNNYIRSSIIKNIIYIFSYNSNFKTTIENDVSIYLYCEKKWHIEHTLTQLKDTIAYFQEIINKSKVEENKKLLTKIDTLKKINTTLTLSNEIDSLTRAFNRNAFNKDIEKKIEQNSLLGLAFIDVDFFKKINDTYGHPIGDEILKFLVNTIFQSMRNNSIKGKVYRYGGEEFILLIEGIEKLYVLGFLDFLRKEIEETYITIEDKTIKFTISIGVSFLEQNDTIDSLIKRADINVYKAKQNGRNRLEY